MDLYEAMGSQRAVRRLRPDPIPDDVIGRILQAAAWAPSGGNVQPFRIVMVTDAAGKSALQRLYAARWATYTIAMRRQIAADPPEAPSPTARVVAAGDHLAAHMGELPAIAVFCFNPTHMAITDEGLGRPTVVGGGSVYPAVQNFMLACRAEGVGCVLTTLLCMDEAEIRPLLGLPDGWYTCAHIPIGYPVATGYGPISRRPVDKMVHRDRWGGAW